jgi:hypothetical protein
MVVLGGVSKIPHPLRSPSYRLVILRSRDVGYESYKAQRRGPTPFEAAHFTEPTRVGLVAVKRAAFQSVASM